MVVYDEVSGIGEVVEAVGFHTAKHVVLRVEETEGVEQAHGFAAKSKLVGYKNFKGLVDGADTAGKGDEGIAVGDKILFPLGNGGDTHQFADGLGEYNLLGEERGDDSYHVSAPLESGTADDTHEAEITATIEECVAMLGKEDTQLMCCVDVFGVARERGSAEDRYVHCIRVG